MTYNNLRINGTDYPLGGGGADWNASEGQAGYVKNRTHYESEETVNEPLNITWDGNTDGLVSVADLIYKISDIVLTNDQLKSTTVALSNGEKIVVADEWNELVEQGMISEEISSIFGFVAIVRKSGATLNGLTFAETGLYLGSFEGVYTYSFTSTEPVEHTKTVVHKINEKFLPRKIVYGDLIYGHLYRDVNLTTYCTRNEIIAMGTNFEVSIVDEGTKTEKGQVCKPIIVKDNGEGSHVDICIRIIDGNVTRDTVMHTDGYTTPPA